MNHPKTTAGPNALAFDAAGNVYISDSFQATIWRTAKTGGTPEPWVTDPLLGTAGVPPFGANGLAFNGKASSLFVANTGNDTIVRIPLPNGAAGAHGMPEVFINSINGADGLIIDAADNLWVAANQADEIVVVDPTGRVIAKLGDFDGIDRQGSPVGLLFPASLVMVDNFLYVTNLSLDLRAFQCARRRFAVGGASHAAHDRPHSRASAADTRPVAARYPIGVHRAGRVFASRSSDESRARPIAVASRHLARRRLRARARERRDRLRTNSTPRCRAAAGRAVR